MKTIIKGKDDLYYVFNISTEQGTVLTPSDLDALVIEFFTPGSESVSFTKDDLTDEGILHVDAESLSELKDGPLKARFQISLSDDAYSDQMFDTVYERLTGYFLKTERN